MPLRCTCSNRRNTLNRFSVMSSAMRISIDGECDMRYDVRREKVTASALWSGRPRRPGPNHASDELLQDTRPGGLQNRKRL
ncbi:hypothetical protein AAFF_G00123250 [Aldrovandia affinis]|uniref:Uncharacterized protein n=1 Tax=Aldrovandia affinis TaxID=143900 RepID=A0AAD7RRL9_9TELE|nr:hypothetical protein AAFF_G00123250 [Aldrovandia affinis]